MEEETKKDTKNFLKKWWFWVGICTIIGFLIFFSIVSSEKNPLQKVNTENLTAREIKEYLEERGYTITARKSEYTKYIYIDKDEISFQRIDNSFIGTSYCWQNSEINGDWADIQEDDDKNTKQTEIVQYFEYTQWLKEINLSKSQIIDVLDYCYKNMKFEEFDFLTEYNSIINNISDETKDDNSISNNITNGTTNNNTASSSKPSETTSNNTSSNSKPSGTTNSNTSSSKPSGTTNSNVSSNNSTSNNTTNGSSSSNTSTQSGTTSQQNALKKAKSYLSHSAFSYQGLIDQLEYEGYSNADAKYAVDNCGANWNEQALKQAKSYLSHSAFSYQGLIDQLEYEDYTSSQAKYGADNCGANWNEQAAKKAKSYLSYSAFSRDGLISQLQYEKFTYEQAVYGVEANGL